VEAGEWNEVDSKLAKIRVELSREPQAARNTAHGSRDKMVEVTNCKVRIKLSVPNII
jgi:hypothetical protein